MVQFSTMIFAYWRGVQSRFFEHPRTRLWLGAMFLIGCYSLWLAGGYVGGSDHWVYLLPSRLGFDPEFLANDWYAQHTTPYHYFYQSFVEMFWSRSLLAEGLLIWHFATIATLVCAVFLWARAIKLPLLGVCAVLCVLAVGHMPNIWGGEPLLFSRAAPSALAMSLTMLSIWAVVERRTWTSAFLLVATTYVHVNVGMWAVLASGAVVVVNFRGWLAWKTGAAAAVSVIVLIPLVLAATGGFTGGGDAADYVALFIGRSPHHYAPILSSTKTHITSLFLVVSGLVAACISRVHRREMLALWLFAAASMAGGFVFLELVPFRFFIRIYAFRLFPLLLLSTYLLLVAGLFAPSFRTRTLAMMWLSACLGLKIDVTAAIGIALVGGALSFTVSARLQKITTVLRAGCLSFTALLALVASLKTYQPANLDPFPEPPGVSFTALREVLPSYAIVVVPPSFEWMRLGVERAVAVDFKGMPLAMPEIREWRRRIRLVTGLDPGEADRWYPPYAPHSVAQLYDRAYHGRSVEQLTVAAIDMNANYIVVYIGSKFAREAHATGSAPIWTGGMLSLYKVNLVATADSRDSGRQTYPPDTRR